MSISKFFAILIAVALVFAPFAKLGGSATAAVPSDRHARTMATDHCDGQPVTGEDGQAAEETCCAATCAAVAPTPASQAEPAHFARSIDRPSARQFRQGFLAKLPTPPPRLV